MIEYAFDITAYFVTNLSKIKRALFVLWSGLVNVVCFHS